MTRPDTIRGRCSPPRYNGRTLPAPSIRLPCWIRRTCSCRPARWLRCMLQALRRISGSQTVVRTGIRAMDGHESVMAQPRKAPPIASFRPIVAVACTPLQHTQLQQNGFLHVSQIDFILFEAMPTEFPLYSIPCYQDPTNTRVDAPFASRVDSPSSWSRRRQLYPPSASSSPQPPLQSRLG